MKKAAKENAVMAMRLILGVVVLVQSFIFLYGGDSAKFFAQRGFPDALRQALGWSEVVAAIFFLMPPTSVLGAWALLAVFSCAILFHLVHGQFEVGGLLVYSSAVMVILIHRDPRRWNRDASAR